MKHRRAPGGGDRQPIMQFILMLLPLLLLCAEAQSDNSNNNNNSSSSNNNKPYGFSPNFNPSMAIVIVVLISAFFFLGFFSIYLRQCFGDSRDSLSVTRGRGVGARSRRQRGLDPEVLATFPTLVYSEIKGHKIGKGALECAVCLCEFENDETLRLLPKCNHVFHPDCIDAWLASHVTCPVCRSDLAHVTPDGDAPFLTAGEAPRAAEEQDPPRQAEAALPEHVAIAVNEGSAEERKAELADLARIASRRRSATAGTRFPRSHSTGHSLVVVHQGDNHDRFTLRLPENIRREIVAAGRMQRAKSVRAFPVGGLEGSTRRGYRGGGVGDGSNRGGQSIRLGRSDRWPSFLMRNISARMPAWATKKGESGDGSTKGGKLSSVRVQFECLGGGGKTDLAGGDGESSSTAAVARV